MKTSGNETYEPPFRATIAISQNAAVSASEAILTRIVKLHFARPAVTTESRIAADNLNQIPVEQLSYFMLKAVRAESQVMATFAERVAVHEERLRKLKEIRVERIIKNHSQMLALLDCLRLICPLDENQLASTQQKLTVMALERQSAISADHPLVAEFWEVYEYLESLGEGPQVNHSADPKVIAIHLNGFVKLAREHHQTVADLKVLRPLLENSRSRKLLEANKSTYSVIHAAQVTANPLREKPKTLRCWVFQSA